MSVLACSRKGCDNIMCDVLLEEYGNYICNNCLEEMIACLGAKPTLSEVNEFMGKHKSDSTIVDLTTY